MLKHRGMSSSPRPARRIAFLDVDGTILEHGTTVAVSTVHAIRAAREAGHLVMLSTGRAASDIHPDVQRIGFDGVISNGGAFADVDGHRIVSRTMPEPALDRLVGYFEAEQLLYFLQTHDGVFAGARVRAAVDELRRAWGIPASSGGAPRFRDLEELDRAQVAKAVFMSMDDAAVPRAAAALADTYHVVEGSMPLPGGSNGEIGMLGVTKGAAILDVLAHLGMDAADAIGVGDSWNDVEMFEVCGVGIAMGNAPEALKQLADEVTTSVSDHGIANAFVRHGLIDSY